LLRSSLTAMYTDCTVQIDRMCIVPGGLRERKVKIGLGMQGTSRLGLTKAEWNVLSTYSFSPITGLIYRHEIESIYPAPHSAVYDSVRDSLLRLLGLKPPGMGSLEGGKVPTVSQQPELQAAQTCPTTCSPKE